MCYDILTIAGLWVESKLLVQSHNNKAKSNAFSGREKSIARARFQKFRTFAGPWSRSHPLISLQSSRKSYPRTWEGALAFVSLSLSLVSLIGQFKSIAPTKLQNPDNLGAHSSGVTLPLLSVSMSLTPQTCRIAPAMLACKAIQEHARDNQSLATLANFHAKSATTPACMSEHAGMKIRMFMQFRPTHTMRSAHSFLTTFNARLSVAIR